MLILFIDRVFREENVRYEVDGYGGVHLYIDVEFQRTRYASIGALDRADMRAAKVACEKCFSALDAIPPDTLLACRSMFEALEIGVKALLPHAGIARLGATEVDRYVRQKVLERYQNDEPARNNANETVNALKAWVNGLQQYRHGQHAPELVKPPLPLAVALISSGASHLRFLVEVLAPAG
jgi:hypothetical protein